MLLEGHGPENTILIGEKNSEKFCSALFPPNKSVVAYGWCFNLRGQWAIWLEFKGCSAAHDLCIQERCVYTEELYVRTYLYFDLWRNRFDYRLRIQV